MSKLEKSARDMEPGTAFTIFRERNVRLEMWLNKSDLFEMRTKAAARLVMPPKFRKSPYISELGVRMVLHLHRLPDESSRGA